MTKKKYKETICSKSNGKYI